MDITYNHFPMGYQNPCRMDGKEAVYAIGGRNPDNNGGGVLFWAYDWEEACEACEAYTKAGYHNVRIDSNNPKEW